MTPEAIRTIFEDKNYKIKIIMSTENILISKGQLSWSFETWSEAYNAFFQ